MASPGWLLNGNQLTTTDNVGIGSAAPATRLHLEGTTDQESAIILRRSDNNKFMRLGVGGSGVALDFDSSSYLSIQNNAGMGVGGWFNGVELLRVTADGLHLPMGKSLRIEGGTGDPNDNADYFSFGGNGVFAVDAPNVPRGRFVIYDDGAVGIGTTQPWGNVEVCHNHAGSGAGAGVRLSLSNGNTSSDVRLDFNTTPPDRSKFQDPSSRIQVIDDGNFGTYFMFLTNNPGAPHNGLSERMRIASGAVSVTGDVVVSGDVALTGADCAEEFEVSDREQPEPGTVVVIDVSGALRESREAYDKKVAGVVSGAGEYHHGLLLDKRPSEQGRVPVALVGKVYCKVDADYSEIEVGDLLTTSPTEGHAMKANDPLKSFGSVIGKALKSLGSGRGLIPVLVALQ